MCCWTECVIWHMNSGGSHMLNLWACLPLACSLSSKSTFLDYAGDRIIEIHPKPTAPFILQKHCNRGTNGEQVLHFRITWDCRDFSCYFSLCHNTLQMFTSYWLIMLYFSVKGYKKVLKFSLLSGLQCQRLLTHRHSVISDGGNHTKRCLYVVMSGSAVGHQTKPPMRPCVASARRLALEKFLH